MEGECVHHWIMPRSSQRRVWGICLHCGETKKFKNSFKEGDWKSQDNKYQYEEEAEEK